MVFSGIAVLCWAVTPGHFAITGSSLKGAMGAHACSFTL